MKKTSITAMTRILKGNSNPYGNEGFYFTDTAGANIYKPIVIIGEKGMGLVIPIR